VAGLLVILGVVAFALSGLQRDGRSGIVKRFEQRAAVAEMFTSSILDESARGNIDSARAYFGDRRPSTASMRAYNRGVAAGEANSVVFDARGKVLLAQPRSLARLPHPGLKQALAGQPFTAGLIAIPGKGAGIEMLVPFRTKYGTRVLANLGTTETIQPFLKAYLGAVNGVPGGQAFVVDQQGRIIGTGGDVEPGKLLPSLALRDALQNQDAGTFNAGSKTRFVSTPVPHSTWRVVLTAPEAALFAAVDGANRDSAWALYAAFAALLILGLFLMLRVLERNRQLAEARQRERTNERLAQERAVADRKAEQLKSEFFALVSHELRTPLTSMIGYLDLIVDEDPGLAPQAQAYFSIVRRNTQRLDALVRDLLLVTQVEAGVFTIEPDECDVQELAQSCEEEFVQSAESVGVNLTVYAEPVPKFSADSRRLAQVLDNLVCNAIKFTPQDGNVAVDIRADGPDCVFEVADTGLGIEQEALDSLFDRFFRSEAARSEHIQGVGLGLAIVSAIVEAHGGDVSVQTEVGRGSKFQVRIPMRPLGARAAKAGFARAFGSAALW
jgi:signal transduction histidine kinase